MQAYAESMRESTDLEIESWPVGQEFRLIESMQSLTLRVIMEAVFGYRPGTPEEAELRHAIRAMIEPIASPRGLLLLRAAMTALPIVKRSAPSPAAERFEAAKRAVDEILYAEIARRRDDPSLPERDDVFSALLLASDDEGRRLSDREVRDELVTLLMAGHETTATGLAWTFDLLLHSPAVHKRALEGDEAYLDAVVKEALRLRAVIPGVGRVVRGEPFRLNGYSVPPGVEINPSIRMMHMRSDLYPEPRAFRPERFLGAGGEPIPDTYTWIPFGGGTRRCLGASFALMEMRIVVRRVLERTALRPADPELEQIQFRAITQAPRNGVRVIQDRPPGAR
jgi:cytochrome P450